MRCYKCNGTGYYDIDNECPVCDGTGEYEPFYADVELDKLYPTEQTNEEWLKSYNTAQLAAWITNEINERVKLALRDSKLNDGNIDDYMENADDWFEWLREKR